MTTRLTRFTRITGPARDKLRDEITKRYKAGDSVHALAEHYGRSYGFVHGLLTEAGVTMRLRGSTRGGPRGGARTAPAEAKSRTI